MAEFETVVIEASILENITETLDEIENALHRLDRVAERVDPIDMDAEIADAMLKLATLRSFISSIDDASIDVDADGVAAMVAGGAAGAMGGGGVFEEADTLREAFLDWRLTMGKFMNVLAAVIPLVAVFIGAIPAVIGGLVALTAAATAATVALAGLAGLALLGVAIEDGEFAFINLRRRFQEMIDAFLSAMGPVAEGLENIAVEAFGRMEALFFDMASVSRSLMLLTDDARTTMMALGEVIPDVIEETILFAEAAMPALMSMMAALGQIDFFGIMAEMMADIVPLMVTMFSVIGRLIPPLMNLSIGFLAVATAITAALGVVLDLINVHPMLARGFGVLIGLLLTAATATSIYSLTQLSAISNLAALAFNALPNVIAAVHAQIAAYTSATFATIALTAATAALLGVLTFGIAPAILNATNAFGALNGDIMTATDSLREFNRVGRRTSLPSDAGPGGPTGLGGPQYPSAGDTVVAPDKETGNAVANSLAFKKRRSRTTSESDVENRRHSG